MAARLRELGELRVLDAASKEPRPLQSDLSVVEGLARFGGAFTPECVAAAPRLRVVGGGTDNGGFGLPVEALAARQIPFTDATRAGGQSVAEVARGLVLGALRQIP